MSHGRALAVLCACALVIAAAEPAPPRRSDIKESKVLQDQTIAVRRMPIAYFYPFSLWPMPRYPNRDKEESDEKYRRSLEGHMKYKKR